MRSPTENVTTRPAERRRARKQLSKVDQDFLNLVRTRFRNHADRGRRMTSAELRRFLGIGNAYIARRLFAVLDDDGDGRVSETDFLKSVVSLILGEDEDKLRFIFRLHDDDADGKIDAHDLDHMLQACLSSNRIDISIQERHAIRDALLARGRRRALDFSAFRRLLAAHELVRRKLIQSVADWFGAEGRPRLDVRHVRFSTIVRQAVVVVPYYLWRFLLVAAYVAANAWFFWLAFSRYRAAGANFYIQVARGAGACLNFNGMLILLPMIRTLMRWIRQTFLFAFIPVDHSIGFHKAVGTVMFFFALVHTGAHLLNYTTLSVPLTDSLLYTKAGLSGLVLLGIFFVMWFFALPFIRRSAAYGLFAITHVLYWAWFAADLIHARSFIPWAAASVAGFLAELIIRRVNKRTLSFVKEGEALRTGVTHLKLHRPESFRFDAGEFAYLRIPKVSLFGWHPFTISSNPEEGSHIGLHIRALGNWTRRLHRLFMKLPREKREMPVLLQGPYGSPSARLFASRHAVLIGAGIGVTPFASILQSIVARRTQGSEMELEKVHFFWLYRGQKTYEWFSEMLGRIDALRLKLLEINIYLTDTKINSTTGLLKIGLDLVQGSTRKDVLTGLTSRTSFGQPDWDQVFYRIAAEHPYGRTDVFFCGPYPLGRIVRTASRRAGFRFRMEQF
jgi:predicted ferric reductase/Ca2+-binding EF-hand superfamily protein